MGERVQLHLHLHVLYSNEDARNEVDAERRYRWLQRRMAMIRDYIGVHMTSSTIQDSGLLHYLHEGINRTGMSFREFVYSEEGRKLAERYDILSEYAPATMIEKFKNHFE